MNISGSDNADVILVRRLYETGATPEAIAEIIDPDVVWDIPPGFPYGGVYHGWASAHSDFLGRLAAEFASFDAVAERFYGTDDHVSVCGHYHAVSKTGQQSDARFVHLWTVRDGKLTHMTQTADSHIVQLAMNA